MNREETHLFCHRKWLLKTLCVCHSFLGKTVPIGVREQQEVPERIQCWQATAKYSHSLCTRPLFGDIKESQSELRLLAVVFCTVLGAVTSVTLDRISPKGLNKRASEPKDRIMHTSTSFIELAITIDSRAITFECLEPQVLFRASPSTWIQSRDVLAGASALAIALAKSQSDMRHRE
ncbi:hypothetical protein C8F04DRAFT_1176327 [Mycena alexandri]|uniref:Uncharacterized protein n=1 Tax=Mycena alexandri TaxID=1745969 RepID=A0AAD6TAM8_9AGAR|nr:hypothetical protein C8F04DRAFT_1176327 [Mycena alexandri]